MATLERIYRFLHKYSGEGESLPRARLYGALVARRSFMKAFYRDVASEVAGSVQGGTILDIGTGPGYLPIEIAKLVPGAELVGIDVSSHMVRAAVSNARRANVSTRVKFLVEDANSMSFEDTSFDLAVSTGSIHHWKRPVHIIDEIHRILKDEREAWIYDLRRDAPEQIIQTLREFGYGRLTSLFMSNAVRTHSGIAVPEMLSILDDVKDMFKRHSIDENWHSYPVVKMRLLK